MTAEDGQTRRRAGWIACRGLKPDPVRCTFAVVGARRRRSGRGRTGADALVAAAEPLDGVPAGGAVRRRRASASGRRSSPRCCRSSAYNFFFIEPLYTFTVAEPYELLALVIFLVVAVMTSALAGRVREQARRRASAACGRRGGSTNSPAGSPGCADATRSPKAPAIEINGQPRPARRRAAARRATISSCAPPGRRRIRSTRRGIGGALGLQTRRAGRRRDRHAADRPVVFRAACASAQDARRRRASRSTGGRRSIPRARALVETLAEQTAAALERARLAREMVAANAAAETERVRNTLLASISHDFRTPLASILGAATSLIDYGAKLPERGAAGPARSRSRRRPRGSTAWCATCWR